MMKKFTFLKSLLLIVAMMVGVNVWGADKWVLTAPADLATGDVVVIVDQTSSCAMSNGNGTSSAPTATSVTLNDGQSEISSEVNDNIQWTVTKNDDEYQFGVGENYLYCTNTNNGVRVGENDNNVFTMYDNGGVTFLYNTATSRYLGVYNSQDWRCYTSINNNIKNCVTAFYKKVAGTTSPLASIALSGSYQTVFHVGDAFTYEGLVVTANYEDQSSRTVSSYTVSEPDMSTTGTKTVTVSYTENEVTKEATYDITVIPAPVVPAGPGAGNGFVLVKDASTLSAGDKLLIVGEGVAMSTTQNNNNRGQVEVTIDGETIETAPAEAQIVTLEGEEGAWFFNVGDDAYLYAASNSSNHLKTADKEAVGDNGKAAIEIDEDGVATIIFQGTNSRNDLRYNSSSKIFSCYVSGNTQKVVYLYRLVEATSFDISMGAAGWRTLVSSVDATLPEGLKAYTVSGISATESSSTAQLAEATAIKAGEPYLLNGAAGTYTLTVTEGVAAPATNLLKVSDETTTNGVYVLANHDAKVGFYKWAGGLLGAGRVYLPGSANAKEFIGFSFDETTGINSLQTEKKANGQFFNLAGQRVAQPQKGLYIVNGKKVIVK